MQIGSYNINSVSPPQKCHGTQAQPPPPPPPPPPSLDPLLLRMVSPSCLSAQPTSPPPPPSQSYSEWSLPAACQLSRQVPPCSHTQNGLSWLPAHTDDKSPPAECLPAQPRSPPPAVTLRMVSPSCLPTQTTSPPPPCRMVSPSLAEKSPPCSHTRNGLSQLLARSADKSPPPAVTLRVVSPSCLPTQTTSPPPCSHTQNGHSQLPAHTNDKSPPPPPPPSAVILFSWCPY